LTKINKYIVKLTEKHSNKVKRELKKFGVEVIWQSDILPKVIAIKTDKPISDLEQFFLFETVEAEPIGRIDI